MSKKEVWIFKDAPLVELKEGEYLGTFDFLAVREDLEEIYRKLINVFALADKYLDREEYYQKNCW